MRTVLICHADNMLEYEGLGRWLASFSELAGIVIIRERWQRKVKRIKREFHRVGLARFLDVLAYRVYDRIAWSRSNVEWEHNVLLRLRNQYPNWSSKIPQLTTPNPNTNATQEFIETIRPDILIARCKVLLTKRVFTIPRSATLVMHPGICPEYRNGYGCFWALVNGQRDRVGMTLLAVDTGVDTGPVYGYYSYEVDEVRESVHMIHTRVVYDNLPQIAAKIIQIHEGKASIVDTRGRPSESWGQPWLTKYISWKRNARRRNSDARR